MSEGTQYEAGTLRYSRRKLVTLFSWLLWGDFCFQIMEMVFLQVMPLKLKFLNASNVLVGIIIVTIPAGMNFVVNPIIGFRSDRFRSPLGRRIPFLLAATPPLSLCLILLGCSDMLGYRLHLGFRLLGRLSPTATVLILVAVFTTLFQVFNMVVNSTYYYLINDVVPRVVVGRFLSLFRVIAALAGALFSFYVFPRAETHMRAIFVGAGLLYFVAFITMCSKVREGEYPPPPENVEGRRGLVASVRTYIVECFYHVFYWDFFLSGTCYSVAGCIGPFMTYLYLSVGVTVGHMGTVMGISQIISFFLWYPAGILTDRVHPVKIMILATVTFVITSVLGLVWLFIHPTPNAATIIYAANTIIGLPAIVLYGAASLPMLMRLLPKERFGQFCSADAMLKSIAVIIATPVLGMLLDALKTRYGQGSFYYRFVPFWAVAFHCLSLIFLFRMYRYWRRHGAEEFVPPQRDTLTRREGNDEGESLRVTVGTV